MKKRTSLMKAWRSFSVVMVITMVVPVQLFVAAPALAVEAEKVTVCHLLGNGSYNEVEVDKNAWDLHESGHSDHEGDFLKEGESCVPLQEDCPFFRSH